MTANGSRVGSRRGSGFDDADVSSILPIIPYGGFSPVRLEGWLIRRSLPVRRSAQALLPAYAGHRPVCVRPSCTSWPKSMAPLCVGPAGSIAHRHEAECSAYPRGPRSGPGYSVPVRHHLIGPIRPTRGHIAISPPCGLYAVPSLCGSAQATREWFRAFTAHSFLACRPLQPREV
jgi:hypothetical protein